VLVSLTVRNFIGLTQPRRTASSSGVLKNDSFKSVCREVDYSVTFGVDGECEAVMRALGLWSCGKYEDREVAGLAGW